MRRNTVRFKVATLAAIVSCMAFSYHAVAACNGKIDKQKPIVVDATPGNNCVKTSTEDCTCPDPYPPNPDVHCERVSGTVAKTTTTGQVKGYNLSLSMGIWVCSITIGTDCRYCDMSGATEVTSTTSGYKCNTTCP